MVCRGNLSKCSQAASDDGISEKRPLKYAFEKKKDLA